MITFRIEKLLKAYMLTLWMLIYDTEWQKVSWGMHQRRLKLKLIFSQLAFDAVLFRAH